MYVYAGKLESDGKVFEAKVVLGALVEKFPAHALSVQAVDRLRQIREQEAGRRAEAEAADAAAEQMRNVAREACLAGCNTLSNESDECEKWGETLFGIPACITHSSPRSRCQSRCWSQ
jgi:hypothetical protein